MSVPPPPQPPRRDRTGNSLAWLVGLLLIAVAALTVVIVLMPGEDEPNQPAAAEPPAMDATVAEPEDNMPSDPPPAEQAPSDDGPGDLPADPPPPEEPPVDEPPVGPDAPGPCSETPAQPMREPVDRMWSKPADIDGDGQLDNFIAYNLTGEDFGYYRVEFANGFAVEAEHWWIGEPDLHLLDVGADRRIALTHYPGTVTWGFGESMHPVSFLYFDENDCTFEPATYNARFPSDYIFVDRYQEVIGGITCMAGGFTYTEARRQPPGSEYAWSVESTTFTWNAASLEFDAGLTLTVPLCCGDGEAIEAIEGIDCPL